MLHIVFGFTDLKKVRVLLKDVSKLVTCRYYQVTNARFLNLHLFNRTLAIFAKGAPARESRTGTRLVSPARDREKKKVPQQN